MVSDFVASTRNPCALDDDGRHEYPPLDRVRASVDMILLGRRIAILLHFTTALSLYETLNLLLSS